MDMRASYGMFPKSPGSIWTTLGVHHGSYAHTMHVRSSQTPKLGSCKRGFQRSTIEYYRLSQEASPLKGVPPTALLVIFKCAIPAGNRGLKFLRKFIEKLSR